MSEILVAVLGSVGTVLMAALGTAALATGGPLVSLFGAMTLVAGFALGYTLGINAPYELRIELK